ncbi:hypothetical protein ERO13_A04G127700v2 [Gossypium hirsutum]|nr:hypothetical protein ERO13_A04G127700v2 [Gossypium hirsutum]
MDREAKNKILIFGGTGYLGTYMVKASIKLGHPTFVFARPITPQSTLNKINLHEEFESVGVTIIQGELKEHEKIVAILRQVDIVISLLLFPQVPDQIHIIEAIKVAGNIKRFLPSEFGVEEDRLSFLPPFEACLDENRKVRRAVEASGIPYTYVSANCFGAYFLNYLLRLHEQQEDVIIYGSGEAKGKYFKKVHVPEEELVKLTETLPFPDNVRASVLHGLFVKGDLANYELGENDLEASSLYPDYKYTTIDQLLDVFLVDPPKPALATF